MPMPPIKKIAGFLVLLWGALAVMMQVGPGEATANLCKWLSTGCADWFHIPAFTPWFLWALVLATAGYVFFYPSTPPNNERNALLRKKWKRRLNAFIHALPIIGVLAGGFLFVGSIAWVLADVRKANDEISRTLTRYVLPRHLTDIQISAISNYLQKFPPKDVKFIVVKNNEEASSYRADFQRALIAGGWTISAISYSDDIGEGVSTEFNEPQVNANARLDPKNPKTDQLFAAALKDAHVRPSGSTSSGSGSGITAETFVIKIGRRRMDDGDLIVKKQIQERKRRLLQEEEESVADD